MKPQITKAASRGWIDGCGPWEKSMVRLEVKERRTPANTAARGQRCRKRSTTSASIFLVDSGARPPPSPSPTAPTTPWRRAGTAGVPCWGFSPHNPPEGGARALAWFCTGKKTPGGAGTHTGHTGHTGARGHTDHTDEPHNHPPKPKRTHGRTRAHGSHGRTSQPSTQTQRHKPGTSYGLFFVSYRYR